MGRTIHPSRSRDSRHLVALFVLLTLITIVPEYARAETEVVTSPQASSSVLKSEKVDLIIPSKARDLFVVLKNGLTVLIRESHGSNVVYCQVLVKTGSISEGARMGGGVSHYLEHVASGGTTSRFTETQIKDKLQALGGAANAYTSYNNTVYHINTTRLHYRQALELLMAYVTDCQFSETEYQREKGVILEEFKLAENDPSKQLWQSFMKTAYRVHPVRHSILGEKEVFAKMDKDDLMAHYHRWYTPDNMVIAVAGDVEKEQALEAILDLAGGLRRAENPPYVLSAEPRQIASRRVEKALPIARLTKALVGFRTIPLTDPDLYALDVLAVIMGDGRTCRLYQSVRDEKELVLSISAWSWTPPFVEGQFTVSMTLSGENLSKAIDAVWEELSDVKESLVSQEALTRAKNKIVADYVFSQESAQSQARQLASDLVATGDPYFSEIYVSKIRQVRLEDIREVARKYFNKDRMTLAVVRPAADVPPDGDTRAAEHIGSSVEKRILHNQMTLLLKRNTSAPIVSFKFFIKGGLRFEPLDKPGLSHFMASLLTKGTSNRSKLEIAEALEDLGGSISASSGHNTVSLSVSVLKEHLNNGLDLLADVVLHPGFPESEIEKQRQDTLMAIKRLDENWTTEITRLFKRHYYRKHPYRNDVLGKAEAVTSFSKKDIRGLYESIMIPNNAVLAVFGDIDPDVVADKVRGAFEGFSPGMLEQPIIEVETHNIEEDESFEIHNEKTSTAILVGYNGMTFGDADSPVVDVLDAIISGIGYPGGWLHEALRGGEKSLVYYVHAYPAFGIDGGYFGIMTQTSPQNHEEVLEIVSDRIALVQLKEVDLKTLQRAKDVCITMHEIGLEKIGSQASSSALNEILGLGYDYDITYPGRIEEVSAHDVLRVAKRLFSHRLVVATKPRKAPID